MDVRWAPDRGQKPSKCADRGANLARVAQQYLLREAGKAPSSARSFPQSFPVSHMYIQIGLPCFPPTANASDLNATMRVDAWA